MHAPFSLYRLVLELVAGWANIPENVAISRDQIRE